MPPVLLARDGAVAVITLNRPDRGNAWTGRMETGLRQAVADAEADAGVGAIVITGAGRQFCVGADSKALEMSSQAGSYQTGIEAPPARPGDPGHPAHGTRLGYLMALTKPVVAAVNGSAAGIGFALLCFADVRFVAAGAKLTAAAPRLGLPAECGLSWQLPRLIGAARATEILLSSRMVSGEEAAAIGLASESLPAGEVASRATKYAATLVRECAPGSLAATKAQLGLDTERSLLLSDRDADERLHRMMEGAEFREGVAALAERRAPQFRERG